MFNAQDIPHKLVEWDSKVEAWKREPRSRPVSCQVIDLSPYSESEPPPRYPRLAALGVVDDCGHITEYKIMEIVRGIIPNASPAVDSSASFSPRPYCHPSYRARPGPYGSSRRPCHPDHYSLSRSTMHPNQSRGQYRSPRSNEEGSER